MRSVLAFILTAVFVTGCSGEAVLVSPTWGFSDERGGFTCIVTRSDKDLHSVPR